jgi:hypothetical protein
MWMLLLSVSAHASMAPRSGDFQVSQSLVMGFHPAVAPDDDGNFLVVWQAAHQTDGSHIVGRLFDSGGLPLEDEFQIDMATNHGIRDHACIDRGVDGSLLVAWVASNVGETPRIEARQLTPSGDPMGDSFQVNTPRSLAGDYYLSAPAVAATGQGFVVAWSSGFTRYGNYQTDLVSDVYGRRVVDGAPVGVDFRVSTLTDPDIVTQNEVDVATRPDGFVVVWAAGELLGLDSDFEVRGRMFDAVANPIGTELVIGEEGMRGPEVAADGAGRVMVAWPTDRYVDYPIPSHVRARILEADGSPAAPEFEVSTPGDDDSFYQRTVAGVHGLDVATTDSSFVVVWSSGSSYGEYGGSFDGDGVGLFTRDFAPSGSPLGIEKQANENGSGEQARPSLAFGIDGHALVVWDANGGPFGRAFDRFARTCGDADESGEISSTDALAALQGAVGIRACEVCVCDADGSTIVSATDALLVLKVVVGENVGLTCEPCSASFAE